jgi:hypothetical protein
MSFQGDDTGRGNLPAGKVPVRQSRMSDVGISGISGVDKTKNPVTGRDFIYAKADDLAPPLLVTADIIEQEADLTGPEEILAIIIGELHPVSTHALFTTCVLDYLARRYKACISGRSRNFIFALEENFNDLFYNAVHGLDLRVPPEIKYLLHKYDADGHLNTKAILADNPYSESPLSKECLFQVILDHNIPVVFNDASIISIHSLGSTFDRKDSLLPAAAENLKKNYSMKLDLNKGMPDVFSEEGMALRNAAMVKRAMDYTKKRGARMIVQSCGMSHLLGNQARELSYEYSLVNQYKKAGCRVLGIFLDGDPRHSPEQYISPTARNTNCEHIIHRGLDRTFNFDVFPGKEILHIARLKNNFGKKAGIECPFRARGQLPDKEKVKKEIADVIARAAANKLPSFEKDSP